MRVIVGVSRRCSTMGSPRRSSVENRQEISSLLKERIAELLPNQMVLSKRFTMKQPIMSAGIVAVAIGSDQPRGSKQVSIRTNP